MFGSHLRFAALADPFQIMVQIGGNYIWGENGTALVKVRLFDVNDVLKFQGRDMPDGGGSWEISLPPGINMLPGDWLRIEHGASGYNSGHLSKIIINRIKVDGNTVSGRIIPPRPTIDAHVEQHILELSGINDYDLLELQ